MTAFWKISDHGNRARLAKIKQDQAKSISQRAKPLGRKFYSFKFSVDDLTFAQVIRSCTNPLYTMTELE